jgi:predicted transcriptional regulator
MRIDDLRSDIHKAIDTIDDESLLNEIQHIIEQSKQDNDAEWDNLPQEVKSAIEEGLAQAEQGRTISNEQAKQKLKKWFSS